METNNETYYREELHSEDLFQGAVDEFQHWLRFRVKNALVLQIFQQEVHGILLDIDDIKTLLQREITTEKNNHAERATRISNETLPKAKVTYTTTGWFDYTYEDVNSLRVYRDAHNEMVDYIEGMELAGDGWLGNLANAYVEEVYDAAHHEASLAVAQHNIKTASLDRGGFVLIG